MIIKGKDLVINNVESHTLTTEEMLASGIVLQAMRDYKLCIKKGALYKSINLNATKTHVGEYNDSCIDIIRNITRNPLINLIYDLDWEYIFKEMDREYGNRFIHYCGNAWVHPWDVYTGNYNITDNTKVYKIG